MTRDYRACRTWIFGAVLLAAALPVQAQVRRCSGADGTTIFTDRQCADVGGVERVPRAVTIGGSLLYRNACSRTVQDLVFELTGAIDSRDVNRMAGAYHWVGVSSATSISLMNRLQAIVQRPLVDITGVYPSDGAVDDYYPQTTVHRAPVGLRLEQTLANGSTPSNTVLGLRHYLGCWWIAL